MNDNNLQSRSNEIIDRSESNLSGLRSVALYRNLT